VKKALGHLGQRSVLSRQPGAKSRKIRIMGEGWKEGRRGVGVCLYRGRTVHNAAQTGAAVVAAILIFAILCLCAIFADVYNMLVLPGG
jgi:hypothetical protein